MKRTLRSSLLLLIFISLTVNHAFSQTTQDNNTENSTSKTQILAFLKNYPATGSDNYNTFINRLNEQVKNDSSQKFKTSNTLLQAGISQMWSLISDTEKNNVKKIANKLNKVYGWKLKMPDEKDDATTQVDNSDPLAGLDLDGLVETEKAKTAQLKQELQKVITQENASKESALDAARKYIKLGGNPADLPGWDDFAKKYKISPADLR